MADMVNHPPHYTRHPSRRETIEITRRMGFNLGNAWKYLARRDLKGDFNENIDKAIWYLLDECRARISGKGLVLTHVDMPDAVLDWVEAEKEPYREIYRTLWNLNCAAGIEDIMRLAKSLRKLQV